MTEPTAPAPAPAAKPDPTTTAAGEEDPGAALDDPALRDALRGEAERSGTKPVTPPGKPRRGG